MIGQKKFRFQKIFGSKKILGKKRFWVQKKCGPKKIESEKYFESKIFGPHPHPYGIGLSMVGWIGRRGVGMGVPFLGFRVAYMSNLNLLQSLEPLEKENNI